MSYHMRQGLPTFIACIGKFLRRHPEVTPTALGRLATGDPGFVHAVLDEKRPRNPTLATVEKVQTWMERYERRHPPVAKRRKRSASGAPKPRRGKPRRGETAPAGPT